MGNKYEILAAHYPFKGYYEKSFQCNTFWLAFKMFRTYKRKGYEIINLSYRKPIKIDTTNWYQVTCTWPEVE